MEDDGGDNAKERRLLADKRGNENDEEKVETLQFVRTLLSNSRSSTERQRLRVLESALADSVGGPGSPGDVRARLTAGRRSTNHAARREQQRVAIAETVLGGTPFHRRDGVAATPAASARARGAPHTGQLSAPAYTAPPPPRSGRPSSLLEKDDKLSFSSFMTCSAIYADATEESFVDKGDERRLLDALHYRAPPTLQQQRHKTSGDALARAMSVQKANSRFLSHHFAKLSSRYSGLVRLK